MGERIFLMVVSGDAGRSGDLASGGRSPLSGVRWCGVTKGRLNRWCAPSIVRDAPRNAMLVHSMRES